MKQRIILHITALKQANIQLNKSGLTNTAAINQMKIEAGIKAII